MLFPTLKTRGDEDLGKVLLDWLHEPSGKQKALRRFIWLAALAVLILLAFSPLMKELGGSFAGALGYALIILFSSLLPRLWRRQVAHTYELRERGLVIYPDTAKEKGAIRFAWWSDFKDVVRRDNGVKLIPKYFVQQSVFLPTGPRRFDVYFVCREKVWQAKFERMMQRLGSAKSR